MWGWASAHLHVFYFIFCVFSSLDRLSGWYSEWTYLFWNNNFS